MEEIRAWFGLSNERKQEIVDELPRRLEERLKKRREKKDAAGSP